MSNRAGHPPPATEEELLDWLAAHEATGGLIGDDAAIIGDIDRVVTVDSQVAGTHFPPDLDARVVARRLLAVNLSDLAAMGARPTHAFVAIVAAPGFRHRDFLTALLAACRRHGLTLAGGDTARGAATSLSLTLIGARWPRARFVRRDRGRDGDALWIGPGSLGESATGCYLAARGGRLAGDGSVRLPRLPPAVRPAARRALRRHFAPRPQLELGRWLAGRRNPAALDVSDGLAKDLHRLCAASGVGAQIEERSLPVPPSLRRLDAVLGLDPIEQALGGGEDYTLLFSLPPGTAPPRSFRCHRIGSIDASHEVRLTRRDGTVDPLPNTGFDHLSD